MSMAPRRLARRVGLALLVALATGHGATAQTLTPLFHGWERYFTITWESSQERGQPVISGYIKNDAGFPARRIQVLVDALDASGRVTGQRVSWLGSSLTPGMRAYFEVPAPPPSAPPGTYRVSVFAFDWVQTAEVQAP
jgi:hypothetical protein